MKNVYRLGSLVLSLSLLNACRDPNAKAGHSSTSSSEAEGIYFNLGKHLKDSGVVSPHKAITIDENGLTVGTRTNFKTLSNFVVESKGQKISAQYFTDLTILKKQIPGHVVDLSAQAQSDKLEAEVNFRIAGNTLYSMKQSTKMNYTFARDIGVTVPYSIIPALTVDIGGKVGGEIGFDVAPGLGADGQSFQLSVDPFANLNGSISAGASVLFARAEAIGKVRIIESEMPIVASLGLNGAELAIKDLKINSLAGKVDLIASLSLGNVLPGNAAQLWKQVFGNGFEYTHPLLKWEGIPVIDVPGHTYTF